MPTLTMFAKPALAAAIVGAVGLTAAILVPAPTDLDRIFDPFFTTKRLEGTGRGLSISYAIIQRYGGRIAVESEPGQGASFTLWLRHKARYAE